MRINAHAHIFNLRSVFTKETLHILLDRLKLDGMPKPLLDVMHEKLADYLNANIEAEKIFESLDERLGATNELKGLFKKISLGDAQIDLNIDGVAAVLGAKASAYIRDKVIELYDLDEDGEIKQNWFDYIEFLRIALMPNIERVTDEVMGQMGDTDGLVALMMDITDGTDDDTLVKNQMKATSDTVLAYPGRIFPFFMVNPIRTSHYELMKQAIEKMGFWGVKLYPSLGYTLRTPEMDKVFKYCADHEIPVLSHCTNGGFNKNTQTVVLANPKEWAPVLKEYPQLKICFGHFGGDESLASTKIAPGTWTHSILDLMQSYNGVFADLGYHDTPMIGSPRLGMSKEEARANYQSNVKKLLGSSTIRDRILFGTDYWMVRTVTKDTDYWSFFENLLTKPQFKRISETNPGKLSWFTAIWIPCQLAAGETYRFLQRQENESSARASRLAIQSRR